MFVIPLHMFLFHFSGRLALPLRDSVQTIGVLLWGVVQVALFLTRLPDGLAENEKKKSFTEAGL